jgi:hypothetical protein
VNETAQSSATLLHWSANAGIGKSQAERYSGPTSGLLSGAG